MCVKLEVLLFKVNKYVNEIYFNALKIRGGSNSKAAKIDKINIILRILVLKLPVQSKPNEKY